MFVIASTVSGRGTPVLAVSRSSPTCSGVFNKVINNSGYVCKTFYKNKYSKNKYFEYGYERS